MAILLISRRYFGKANKTKRCGTQQYRRIPSGCRSTSYLDHMEKVNLFQPNGNLNFSEFAPDCVFCCPRGYSLYLGGASGNALIETARMGHCSLSEFR